MFTKVIKVLNGLIERLTPKQLLIITAGVGLLVCLIIYITLNRIEESLIAEQPKPIEMTQVVVARVNIPRGTILQDDMLRVKEFAVSSLPPGTAGDVSLFVGLPTKLEIFAEDIITSKKVFTDFREAGFIGMIPEDCRAVSIPINNVTGISGLIKAGDYVDVIMVSSERNATKAEVILQNILLLSINRNASRQILESDGKDVKPKTEETAADQVKDSADNLLSKGQSINREAGAALQGESIKGLGGAGDGGGAQDLGTVTLALRPDDVTKVAACMASGTIQLALRPFKPKPSSMYIAETEYYISSGGSPNQSFLERENREYNYARDEVAQIEKIPNNPLPIIPPPSLPNIGNGTPGGYEIVRWGN